MAVLQTTTVPVGSAGTPGLAFTGRTNDGIYSPAEDQVAIATSGTLRVLVGNSTFQYNGNDVAVKNADGTLTIADGTAANHAVTKGQLDAVSSGLDAKASCRVATTGSETFTIASGAVTQISGTTVDGVTPAIGDRILIKNAPAATGAGSSPETTQPGNGIYKVDGNTTNLTVSRATDADTSSEVTGGMYVFVTEGTSNADNGYVLTTNDTITLNTTALTFVQFSGAGQITAGAALTKTGNTLDVAVDNVGIEINTDALRIKDGGVTTAKLATSTSTTTGVTFDKLRQITTDRLIGRDTAATGAPEEISVSGGIEFTGSGGIQTSAFTGDVTKAAGGTATTIANNAVTNAKFRQSAGISVVGRSVNSTGDVADIVATTNGVLREGGGVISFGTIDTTNISNSVVTNAKLADMATNRIKGRITAGTGPVEDLNADGVMTIINTSTTDLSDNRLSANVPLLNLSNSYTKAQITVPVALTDAATVAIDASASNVFTLLTTAGVGNTRALGAPTNPTHGQSIVIHVKQDGTGSRALTYDAVWAFKGSSTLSTAANSVDFIVATYNSTDVKWHAVLHRQAGIDADTLDGIDSTAFLRTNGTNTATAAITFSDATGFLVNFSGLATTGIKWDTTANQIQFQDVGTTRAYVDLDNGELSATSIVETSDERLKENIVYIDGAKALKQVKKLQGVYFTRKDTQEREIGLIAQRVKALEPMLVSEDNNGYLSVYYTRLTALLIESIKEQQEQIDSLRQELDNIKYPN